MSDKEWVTIQEIPGFENIYQDAARAQELFTEQELTDYAEEWKQTPEGKKFMKWVSTLEWRIGGANE
jgi:hypothetical protein